MGSEGFGAGYLGTCILVGCIVDGKDLKNLQREIAEGKVKVLLE